MLRLRLTPADLTEVRVACAPAPMMELAAHVRTQHCPRGCPVAPRPNAVALLGDLISWTCSPAFMLPTIRDGAEAIDTVVSTPTVVVRRDLDAIVAEGRTFAPWTADLARPGHRGRDTRRTLGESLQVALDRLVTPTLRRTRPLVNAVVRQIEERLRTEGAAAVLDSLHPRVRCAEQVLTVDLVSGAEVHAASFGTGLVIVPSLTEDPTITISSDGNRPTVLSVPIGQHCGDRRIGNLHALIGAGRATVLETIALRPGSSTTRVARDAGMSPASVSEHARVLRENNLVVTLRQGSAVAHFATDFGHTLLGE